VNLWTVGCADPSLTAQARSPMDKPGKNAMRFPHLAHRSAAAHKPYSTPHQDRMKLISGKGERAAGYRGPLAYPSPEAVQTTGTVAAIQATKPVNWPHFRLPKLTNTFTRRSRSS
jgi:hypothetical protein